MAEAKKQLVLPGYPELEKEVVGASLIVPESCPRILCGLLSHEDFTDERCSLIVGAIESILKKGKEADAQSVFVELSSAGTLNAAGGNQFIFDCLNSVILDPVEIMERHSKLIRTASVARRMIRYCRKVATSFPEMLSLQNNDWEAFLESVRSNVDAVADDVSTVDFVSSKEAAKSALDEIKAAKDSVKNGLIGVETGLNGLDRLTHGWQPGQLIVIAGKPSMGKSAFASHSAYSAALSGAETAYFSLEMSVGSNLKRILSNESKVTTEKMVAGYASNDEIGRLEKAADRIGETPLWITDRMSGYEEISSAIARLKARRQGLKVVFIDYLQLMSTRERGISRDREIGIETGGLKRLATKLGIAIVVLSQVKRGTGDDRPSLDDLRESGNIEQDASVVVFIHRPDYFDRGKPQTRNSKTEIIVAKNREGQTGTVHACFDKGISRFDDLAETDEGEDR